MPYYKDAGKKLKEIRMTAGISLRELARRIDFSPSYVSHVEKGDKRGSVDFFQKCADVLNVSVGDLFEGQKALVPKELKKEGVEWILLFNEMEEKGITTEQVMDWIKEYKNNSSK